MRLKGKVRVSSSQLSSFAQRYMKSGVKHRDALKEFVLNFFKVAGMSVTISEAFGFDGYEIYWTVEAEEHGEDYAIKDL